MAVAKEYLLLMLCWTNCFSLLTFLLRLTPGMCSANLWATGNLSLPDTELGMWQEAADHQPSCSWKREKRRDSEAGRRVELFMLLLLLFLLLFYFPHSLLTDVPLGNVFGDYFSPSSFSYLSCNSSFFSPSPASISGENSVLERAISCSWETGLDLRSTSVTSMSFPKSTCSPGARHPNSFSSFQTDNSWDRDNKLHISQGNSNLHNLTKTNLQMLNFSLLSLHFSTKSQIDFFCCCFCCFFGWVFFWFFFGVNFG